ncbi:thrombomodulin [Hemicordylus capensis]|uniref:thrombomodulin n=1 Tax=Hemicordylus capensis TaxID=884348 RepID=UPI002302135C|nr:thrombomodulin [Hemicordylus capensis]
MLHRSRKREASRAAAAAPAFFRSDPSVSFQLPAKMRPLRLLLVALALAGRRVALAALSPPATPLGAQCVGSSCFSLFWAARSFSEAGDVCAGGGGHLMSVRSTVEAEAIALLLRGQSGSAWLGLRLPANVSAEPAKPLRGFHWVAGDEDTDYSNWTGHHAAAGVRGPRCVVVTHQLSWEERACDASAEGLLCEYSYPGGACAPLSLPQGASVSYLTPFGARDGDLVALPPGTTAEVLSLGASLECRARGPDGLLRWSSPLAGAWNCELQNGGCEEQCAWDDQKRPFCTCSEGKTLAAEDKRTCVSPCDVVQCQQFCIGLGVCMCEAGYELDVDGKSCKDIDDCKVNTGLCPQLCVNTMGGFECKCSPEYELVMDKCIEREMNQNCFDSQCEHDCVPLKEGYTCSCRDGFIPDPKSPHKCLMFCNKSQCPAKCDPHSGTDCDCPDGFILEEKDEANVCSDINECDSGECGKLECINTPGSYKCRCSNGSIVEDLESCKGPGTESYPKTSVSTSVPPKHGSSSEMLVAIRISTMSVLVVLGAILW